MSAGLAGFGLARIAPAPDRAILKTLRDGGAMTYSEIAQATGVNPGTISRCAQKMVREGRIVEAACGPIRTENGRIAKVFSLPDTEGDAT